MDLFERQEPFRISLIFLLLLPICWIIPSWGKQSAIEPQNSSALTFVDSQTCSECHQTEYREWQGSHHALAMQKANSKTVLGNFDNVFFQQGNVTTRFFKKTDQYYIHTQGLDGKYMDFIVKYTFGVDPLQQYLLEFPNGRLQAFTIACNTRQKNCFI